MQRLALSWGAAKAVCCLSTKVYLKLRPTLTKATFVRLRTRRPVERIKFIVFARFDMTNAENCQRPGVGQLLSRSADDTHRVVTMNHGEINSFGSLFASRD